MEQKKITDEAYLNLLRKMAQDPERYIRGKKEQGTSCFDSITFLMQLRNKIYSLPQRLTIEDPNPLFKQLYTSSNGTIAYYEALFTLLKNSGFSRLEMESAFMDHVASVKGAGVNRDRKSADTISIAIDLSQKALTNIFGATL